MAKADIGLIGLAVMGENLILNMESKGFTVACFNRTVSKVDKFIEGRAKGKNIIGCHSIAELAENLEKPRKIMLMVKAGEAVDAFIDKVLPHLEDGDARANSTSAPASRAAKKAPCSARRLCPAVRRLHGSTSDPSSRPFAPRPKTANHAANGSARTVPDTSSKWSITASSTATCR